MVCQKERGEAYLCVVFFVLLKEIDAQLGKVDKVLEFLHRRHSWLFSTQIICLKSQKYSPLELTL